MPWPKIGATQYHAQLGLPEKGRGIKGWLSAMKYCYDLCDGTLGKHKVSGLVPCRS